MKIKKAVIAAAGFGTRRLPVTKAIQKELLPYLNKPMIDYVVDACIEAGIEEFIFVVKSTSHQIREYYSQNPALEVYLEQKSKTAELAEIRKLHTKAKYTYVTQNEDDGYGTAVPLKLTKSLLEHEDAFVYMGGDDIIVPQDGESFVKKLIDEFVQTDAVAAGTFIRRPKDQLYKYGIASVTREGDHDYLQGLVEKPEPGTEPSDLANISKYIFTPQVFELLDTQERDPRIGEYIITETLEKMTGFGKVLAHETSGDYLDGGSIIDWLIQNIKMGLDDDKIGGELKLEIQQLLDRE